MADALSDGDRLPWLDAPRPATPVAARPARTPLLVLLGLFLVGVIGVLAFLTGWGTAPIATSAPEASEGSAPTARVANNVPAPAPALPIIPPAPVRPLPVAPVVAEVDAAPATPRAARPTAGTDQPTDQSARAGIERDSQPSSAAAVARPPTSWSDRPFAQPSGRVIQVGIYATQAQADAAWWRLARSHPYLGTLPRVVTPVVAAPGLPPTYQIRLAVGSRGGARSLCENLHRDRRGCIIDWSQK